MQAAEGLAPNNQSTGLSLSQLDAVLLKSRLMEAQKSWNNALEFQNQLIVSFPW